MGDQLHPGPPLRQAVPMLSTALSGTWLVLAGISPLHLAFACLFAIIIPLVIAPLLGGLRR